MGACMHLIQSVNISQCRPYPRLATRKAAIAVKYIYNVRKVGRFSVPSGSMRNSDSIQMNSADSLPVYVHKIVVPFLYWHKQVT